MIIAQHMPDAQNRGQGLCRNPDLSCNELQRTPKFHSPEEKKRMSFLNKGEKLLQPEFEGCINMQGNRGRVAFLFLGYAQMFSPYRTARA